LWAKYTDARAPVRQDGVEVAETCIGGVEVDDSPELFVWMELLPEAIAEARYNIDKIVANNPKVA
jgi:hypothetical protein